MSITVAGMRVKRRTSAKFMSISQIILNNDILMEKIWEFIMVLFILIRKIEDCVTLDFRHCTR